MKTVRKVFNSPFLLDRSKLTRLASVIRQKLTEQGGIGSEQYSAYLSSDTDIPTSSLEEILDLDNTDKHRIRRLTVTASVTIADEHRVEVDFDGSHKEISCSPQS